VLKEEMRQRFSSALSLAPYRASATHAAIYGETVDPALGQDVGRTALVQAATSHV
jgi:hypothetical protein